jgi:hypothetical protein
LEHTWHPFEMYELPTHNGYSIYSPFGKAGKNGLRRQYASQYKRDLERVMTTAFEEYDMLTHAGASDILQVQSASAARIARN